MTPLIRALSRSLLATACLVGISLAPAQQRDALPTGGLPAMLMQQAGSDPLAKKAALRWTQIEHWASMDDLDGTGPFPASYAAALASCTGDTGARDLLRQNADHLQLVAVNDSGVVRDVDTPADLPPRR